MRVDAYQNRVRILDAASQLLVEHGPDVPLDQIAARAGVSIATLYRRFEDRAALLRATVVEQSAITVDSIDTVVRRVEAGMDRHHWTTAMHDLVVEARSRLGPILAVVTSGLLPFDDDGFARSRRRIDKAFGQLVDAAQAHGLVRADTDHREFSVLLLHALQPVPRLPAEHNHALTSRVVHVVLAGLHPDAAGEPLPGPPFHHPDSPPCA